MIKIHTSLLAILFFAVSSIANANPFSVTWTDTLSASSNLPYIVGEAISITFVLDNGGTSAASQTWNAVDVVSVTFVINNAPSTITTVFDPNSGNGLSSTAGSFATDAAGTLTSAPSAWVDSDGGSPIVSSNDPQGTSTIRWWVNSANEVLQNQSASPDDRSAFTNNVSTNSDPAFWTNPAAVVGGAPTPVPTLSEWALILLVMMLAMFGVIRIRSRV